ncbi:putative endopeptidase, NLPC/P60 domain, LRAT-like domain protein [Tanacetum coccineum]|uniref:Endopeptidase, NLPC/P60 domain, LRAT-like domain protein n=1 Tax=Tanacetum coccineum TaxID=301880 RepID=A0ABQ5HQC7_9ASTR
MGLRERTSTFLIRITDDDNDNLSSYATKGDNFINVDPTTTTLLPTRKSRSELKEGDRIYTWRKQLYSHHGIFVGEGKIIHFVSTIRDYEGSRFLAALKILSGSSTSHHKEKSPCSVSYCGLEKVAESGVKLSCINCFLKKGSLYRFKYQASIEFLYAKARGGTCSMAKSDPLEDVMHRATYLYENGYGKYDLMNNNCEDFALYCKTGLWSTDKESQGRSSQANMVRPTRHAKKDKDMIESVTRIATSIPRSFSKRENKDLGHRNDVVKVPVEDLSSFCRSLNQ